MSLISFENVSKRFGAKTVLDGLSLTVEKGEIVAVVGPSGTGKSVLLKHVVGLLAPDGGRVVVGPTEVSSCTQRELESVRRRIGYLFQGGALLAWRTVAENVALPLVEGTRLSEAEIDARVEAALEAVGLSEAADRYPSEISGGMQKRAGLARAIVREADVMLYDEPTSGLDPVTAAQIHGLIGRLNRTRGLTSVVVTHDVLGALKLADRLVLLKGGRIVLSATPEEFLRTSQADARAFLAAAKGEAL